MKIENPFESGHIKNYILLYASVVVIMVLFFLATTLFHEDTKQIEKKQFNTSTKIEQVNKKAPKVQTRKFKLLEKSY